MDCWRAESPSDHIFVLSRGRVSRLQCDAFTVLADIEDGFVEDLVRVDPKTLAFVGSEGMIQTLRDGALTALESTTEEDLRVVTHHNGALIAGGSYATLVHQHRHE